MIDYSDFFEEVIQTHVEIEQWFAGLARDEHRYLHNSVAPQR